MDEVFHIIDDQYSERRRRLKQQGAIPICGYRPMDEASLFPTCQQETAKGKRCYYHKKKEAGLF